MYFCEDCNEEIDDTDIIYDILSDADKCPECGSYEVEWFDCLRSE